MSPPSTEALQQYLRRLCDDAMPPEDDILLRRFVEASELSALAVADMAAHKMTAMSRPISPGGK